MVLEEVGALPTDVFIQVHEAWVPFVLEGRYRVDTPVDEDAQLGILEPLRDGIR